MKVLLVYPHLNNPNPFPPMGIVHLGTFLKKQGIDVKLMDLTFSESYAEFLNALRFYSPDIVGISVLTVTYNHSIEIAKMVKESNQKCQVIFGGPHVTALPELVMQNKEVDIAVAGEGENTLLEIVKVLSDKQDISRIQGIYYRSSGNIKFTGRRPFIEDLDTIGIPDRSILPTFRTYLKFPIIYPYLMPWTILITSRGCPFQCAFCQPLLNNIFGNKVRFRSPLSVVDEAEELMDNYGLKSFYFTDDTFLARKEWAKEVCFRFKERKINKKVVWGCQTNVNTFSEDKAYLLKEAGCIFVGFGVESGNEYILNEILNKGQTVKRIKEAFLVCKKVGLVAEANLIIGNPTETEEMVKDTIRLVREIRPDVLDTHFLTPTPGSTLYQRYSSDGILMYKNWEAPNRYTAGLIKTSLPKEKLSNLYDEIYITYLKNKSIFRIKWHWFRWFISVIPSIFILGKPAYVLRFLINCIAEQDYRLYRVEKFLKELIKKTKN